MAIALQTATETTLDMNGGSGKRSSVGKMPGGNPRVNCRSPATQARVTNYLVSSRAAIGPQACSHTTFNATRCTLLDPRRHRSRDGVRRLRHEPSLDEPNTGRPSPRSARGDGSDRDADVRAPPGAGTGLERATGRDARHPSRDG